MLAEIKDPDLLPNHRRALRKSSRWWRSLFLPNPAGWGKRTSARMEKVVDDSNAYIQKLNDEYTNPSGEENGELSSEEQAMEASRLRDTLRGNTGPCISS
ncbi:MAG: hypothetical protein JRE36_03455 [Deltaproteobacteria bacterium]|nr:hypothetical protein [Deltaproteobacteria bacterium]